jgi:hypothetical protein
MFVFTRPGLLHWSGAFLCPVFFLENYHKASGLRPIWSVHDLLKHISNYHKAWLPSEMPQFALLLTSNELSQGFGVLGKVMT